MRGPTILDRPEILLVGMSFFGDPFQASGAWTEDNAIGCLWQRFTDFLMAKGSSVRHGPHPDSMVEAHIYTEEAMEVGEWEVFVGIEVERLESVPLELVVKVLPASTYAVFTVEGEEIGEDWSNQIYAEGLPGSGYKPSGSFAFQYYDERFKGVDNLTESVLDVYVPVAPTEAKA
jgi:predicted transcriptional regulator YdeE